MSFHPLSHPDILRKLTIFGVVVVAAQIDQALGLDAICRTAAVLENAAAIGLPVPPKLVEVPWSAGMAATRAMTEKP